MGMLEVVRHNAGAPKYVCRLCHQPFFDGEHRAYERHVVGCSTANEQRLIEQSIKQRLPELYGDEAGDPELERWVDRHRTALQEKRMRI
jgi:hypothetical protein